MRNALRNALLVVLVSVVALGVTFAPNASANWRSEMKVIGEALAMIETDYLWPVDLTKCSYDMLKELTRRTAPVARTQEESKAAADEEFVCLDRYSGFFDPEETRQAFADSAGHFGGVGLQISQKSDKVFVESPIEGSPAERAGILAGDIIVGVRQDGQLQMVAVKNVNVAMKAMRGKAGTKVFVTIERNGKTFEVEIGREEIVTSAVSKKSLPGGVGYISLKHFSETMADDLDLALASFRNTGPNPMVVLDFRDNSGGLLTASLEVLYMVSKNPSDTMLTMRFRDPRKNVVYTIAKPGYYFEDAETHQLRKPGKYAHYKIVVLINERSASASEIVGGTMKDWHFEVISDVQGSFGKGIGQNVAPLSDGSSLHYTTFEFLTGNNKVKIHEVGVKGTHIVKDSRASFDVKDPKLLVGKTDDEKMKLFEQASREYKDNTATDKDAQFMKALELLNKK